MGVLNFLRVGRRQNAAEPATVAKPAKSASYGAARKNADVGLERLKEQFGSEVAPLVARLREAVQWHRNGRKADAWVALEELLSDPTIGGSTHVRPAVETEIYNCMRVCFEREGCFNPALTPAVLSYATRAKAYSVQGREAEFLALRSPDFFERYFSPLLERARVLHALPKFRALVEEHLTAMPMVDVHALRAAIEAFRLNPPGPAKAM